MREIKFRFWFDDVKQMVYYNLQDFWEKEAFDFSMAKPPMEFTGLKDKNKKEIYEEDIIRIEHRKDSFIEIVQYRQEVCAFETNMKRGLGISESFYPNYEIIGNIYENPELVK